MDGLVQVLAARLKLPPDCPLKATWVNQFSKYVEDALFAKRDEWKPHLELGRAPSWFLARCLPVASLLYEACSDDEPSAKCAKLAHMPSCTHHEATMLLLNSLTEDDHIVLLALYRLKARGLPRTLSVILHEVQLLHQDSGHCILHAFNADFYAAAFDRLLRLRLIELTRPGTADMAKAHTPCVSSVDCLYAELVRELNNAEPAPWKNPLRALPQAIQQWAARQRSIN
jgi:hypothetical protein